MTHRVVVPGNKFSTDEKCNAAIRMPERIDLPDGRQLRIRMWRPRVMVGERIEIEIVAVPLLDDEVAP